MADEPKDQKLKKELQAAEEELSRVERESEEIEENKRERLKVDEDIGVRSKIASRELIKESENPENERIEQEGLSSFLSNSAIDGGMASISTPPTSSMTSLGITGEIPNEKPYISSAVTLNGLIKEGFAGRYASRMGAKIARDGMSFTDLFKYTWAIKRVKEVRKERMESDLRYLEERTSVRIKEMNRLSLMKATGSLDADDSKRLRDLTNMEFSRYWMREKLIEDLPMHHQLRMGWLRPIGEGAYGIMPYTYISAYDRLTKKQRGGMRWLWDNAWLRNKSSIVGGFLPKKSKLWASEGKKRQLEYMFDDVNEEIYSEKAFAAQVKKGNKELEDMHEELMGYDNFTVEEEQQMAKMLTSYIKDQIAISKEEEYYS